MTTDDGPFHAASTGRACTVLVYLADGGLAFGHHDPARPCRRRSHTRYDGAGGGNLGDPWPEHLHPAISAGLPLPLSGTAKPVACGQRPRNLRRHALCRLRPWQGAEIWINPEADQGFGLSNSFGVAGYVSGEAYKLGQKDPYYRMSRAFFRQTIDLGGETEKVDPDLNQLGGSQTANRVVITVGKSRVVDIFDTNKYAHDPRNDFLNWAILDAGTFDYAADAWGATYGAAVEWYQDWWTLRVGLFDLSDVPNSIPLSLPLLHQNSVRRGGRGTAHAVGSTRQAQILYWLSRGNLGTYSDALALAAATATTPSTGAVRNYRSKYGVVLNLEQQLMPDLGMFARLGWTQGGVEEVRFHRHRPDGADRPVDDWRALGPAGRHGRTRRRGQSDLPQRQELSGGGWPGRDHWRRPAADGWAGADHRDLLQLFGRSASPKSPATISSSTIPPTIGSADRCRFLRSGCIPSSDDARRNADIADAIPSERKNEERQNRLSRYQIRITRPPSAILFHKPNTIEPEVTL